MKYSKSYMGQLFSILLVILLVFHSAYSFAQLNGSTIGIKAGMNVMSIKIKEFDEKENRIGYHFGGFSRLQLTESFSIQPELLFSNAATTVTYTGTIGGNQTSDRLAVRLNYADIPVMAAINITSKLSLQGGLYGSYLISTNSDKSSTNNTSQSESKPVNTSQFNRVDAGWLGGASLDFGSMNFGVRYLKSFNSVGDSGSDSIGFLYNFPDGQREAWQVYVGLKFF
ncbi:MAG: PorT family protein [Bacteroidetes bacterium]|nr:MAG: PorT family protein [Bacteroidota bacterium]REK06459.1 MAG: PorT family protein [Bacteroidota bacterium]REK33225.1 MAG: PorT family protein [Bacteroidota bacterium]REK47062.1 MAG: PorT family protein [Bacteroidota bacterium]